MGCGASSTPVQTVSAVPTASDPEPIKEVHTGGSDSNGATFDNPEKEKKEKKKKKKDKKDRRDKDGSDSKDIVSTTLKQNPTVKKNIKEGGFGRHNFIVTNTGKLDDLYTMKSKTIGKGTYGSVQKASNKATGVVRAVKSIPKKSLPDPSKFAQEIEIMRILDHPNIIKLYETFEDAKYIYLVMELCTGGELFDRIIDAECGFTEKVAAHLVKQILGAVLYMHMATIAHRDLKPENFLLANEKDVSESPIKVIDFGLSKQFDPGGYMTTKACTPYYVAPEVLEGKYTELCDVWSMGVLIYVLLCGAPPFFGDSDSQVLKRVKRGVYDFDMPAWDTVSEDAKDLISKMLVLKPEKRYTAEQSLHHRWVEKLAPNSSEVALSVTAFDNLKAFRAANKLKKAALTVIAQQLGEDSIKDLKEMFYSLDADGDGTVTVEEMREGIAKMGIAVPPDLKAIMEQVDSDGSGVIDYTEFLAATLDMKQYIQEDVCWAAFRVFDLDGNGKITKDELAEVLSGGACKQLEDALGMERDEIERIMAENDQNGDGELDFEEFMVMMRQTGIGARSPMGGKSPQ